MPSDWRDEPLSGPAIKIQRGYASGKIQLQAPDLIFREIGTVLRKSELRGKISAAGAQAAALDAFVDFKIRVSPSRPLLKLAFSIAKSHGGSVYDCIYVALAVIAQQPLITADERLANRVGGY